MTECTEYPRSGGTRSKKAVPAGMCSSRTKAASAAASGRRPLFLTRPCVAPLFCEARNSDPKAQRKDTSTERKVAGPSLYITLPLFSGNARAARRKALILGRVSAGIRDLSGPPFACLCTTARSANLSESAHSSWKAEATLRFRTLQCKNRRNTESPFQGHIRGTNASAR